MPGLSAAFARAARHMAQIRDLSLWMALFCRAVLAVLAKAGGNDSVTFCNGTGRRFAS